MKGPDCVHLWVKFSIQNMALRVFRRKIPIFFPAVSLFLVLLTNVPERFLAAHLHSGIILFAKRSILNIWQCSEYTCFDNWSVICTGILCYVCTASETFRILAYSALCFFKYILTYSIIFSVVKAYLRIFRHYWDIFRHIQHPV